MSLGSRQSPPGPTKLKVPLLTCQFPLHIGYGKWSRLTHPVYSLGATAAGSNFRSSRVSAASDRLQCPVMPGVLGGQKLPLPVLGSLAVAIGLSSLDQSHFFFLPHSLACRILYPWPGIERRPLAVRALSPNHWEFPVIRLKTLFWKFLAMKFTLQSSWQFCEAPHILICSNSPHNCLALFSKMKY